MTRSFRAELVKLRRPRLLLLTALAVVVFALSGAAIVLAAAEPAAMVTPGRGLTREALAAPGGGTAVFRTAASFAGVFMFVVFVGAFAMEFARGTFRTTLLRQPRRVSLLALAGKLAALLTYVGAMLLAAEVLTWLAARVLAPSAGVAAGSWISVEGLATGIADYGAVLFWVASYAALGMTLAVLTRSLPVAMAVGIAWAGPFEHLVQDAWDPASRLFPGLLLEAFVAGGTPEVSAWRAFVTIAAYVGVAALVAGASFARRDVV
jgi:ABC-2 type transport system permease protein